MNLLDEVNKHRKGIKHETLTFSLMELVNMHSAEEIVIQPNFQRLFRWSREQQSTFIESLILEIPIPPLFFYERDDGKWELLDGLQRLSTVIRFLRAEPDIPPEYRGTAGNEADWHYEHENDLLTPLQLLSGDYLSQLEGLSFSTIPVPLQLNLKRTRLHIDVLKRETDKMYKYEVFKRLNQGGSLLEEQEMRNCSVRLLADAFPEFLQRLAKNADYRAAVGLSDEDFKNGYIEELVLRFFSMKNHAALFRHDVAAFMTKYMEEIARNALPFDYQKEEAVFTAVWKTIRAACPSGEAFRARTYEGKMVGPFSPALFEMITVGLAENVSAWNDPSSLAGRVVELISKAKTDGLTGSGSNSRKKTLGRINLGKTWFKPPQ
jgi:hypothetical protein